jgi:hypothetical protein
MGHLELAKKREKKEERLYEPIKNALQKELEAYLQSKKDKQSEALKALNVFNVYLEITANGKELSDKLKEVLGDDVLSILRVEKFSPDIMGFVQTTPYQTDLVTVEVKHDKITIQSISKAKLYKEVFRARYGMLISPKGIGEEMKRFISNRWEIRGDIVITQFDETNKKFCFDKRLYSTIPEPFVTEEVKYFKP